MISPEILSDLTEEEASLVKDGICIQCGLEHEIDGLYGPRCIQQTHDEHRSINYRRSDLEVPAELSKPPRPWWKRLLGP